MFIEIMKNSRIGFAVIGLAVCCHAATNVFVEAVPPKGVVTGYMQAKGRYGAVVKEQGLVFSNDIFTVVADGYQTTWKVLELTPVKHRFARGDSVKVAITPESSVKIQPSAAPSSIFQDHKCDFR